MIESFAKRSVLTECTPEVAQKFPSYDFFVPAHGVLPACSHEETPTRVGGDSSVGVLGFSALRTNPLVPQLWLTWILRFPDAGACSGAGARTSSTPSLYEAVTSSSRAPGGRAMVRVNEP
jgi:hypothetical protein